MAAVAAAVERDHAIASARVPAVDDRLRGLPAPCRRSSGTSGARRRCRCSPVPEADLNRLFTRFANATARAAGTPVAFLLAVGAVLLWGATGPLFRYSETWQLVINTGTTIITFLMVFVIQNSQNRDSQALQTKLDELIRSSSAGNEFIGIEKLSDRELDELHERCAAAAERSQAMLERTHAERKARKRA